MQILVRELADAGVWTIKKYKINVYLGKESQMMLDKLKNPVVLPLWFQRSVWLVNTVGPRGFLILDPVRHGRHVFSKQEPVCDL